MPYEIHITKPNRIDFSLEDWKSAVRSISVLRLNSCDRVATNPRTGAQVSIPGIDGDVEMYIESSREWFVVFRWADGVVNFNARGANAEVWRVAADLASKLGAQVVGDNGECYTSDGDPIRA